MTLPASEKGAAIVVLLNDLEGLEIAMGSGSPRVHDALMIEVGDLLAQNEIFQQCRAAQTGLQGMLVVGNGHALVGRQRIVVSVFGGLGGIKGHGRSQTVGRLCLRRDHVVGSCHLAALRPIGWGSASDLGF